MKIFLCCLAAIVLAAAMVSFLARSVSPLGRMTLTKEALDKAPDRTDGYEIAFQAIKDPSGSRIIAPLDKPSNPFNATSAWVRRNLIGVESWIKQAIRAGRDTPAAEARREGNVVTLTKDVSIHIKNGIIGLPVGKKLAFVSRRGAIVQVRDINGENYDIPISATDLR